jgi:hypothetical protein
MPFVSDNIVKTIVPIAPSKPLTPITANEYEGEWVNWTIGNELSRDYIRNKINFFRPNSSSIVFGNGRTRTKDLINKIIRSNTNKIINYYNVLYGCNLAYVDFQPDFLVITNKLLASKCPKEIHEIMYTRPEILRIHPNMNLIPINHNMDAGSTAAMLACYHGATKVFLIGFDGCPENVTNHIYVNEQFYPGNDQEMNDNKWQDDLGRVIAAYPGTMFYRLNTSPPNARKLLRFHNYKIIDQKTFASLADI